MIPITRKEHYLNRIVGNKDYPIPEKPITTEEFFFAEILGEAVQAPAPLTRYQMYLAKIAGKDVEIPYPETRLEYFLARAAGMDVETPVPITREEIYWSNYTATTEFELEGVPPLIFRSDGSALKNYRFYGATGGIGDYDEESGKYVIPVTIAGKNKFDGTLFSGYYTDSTMTSIGGASGNYKSCKVYLSAGTYTFSCSVPVLIIRYITSDIYRSNPIGSKYTQEYTFTLANDSYVSLAFRNESNTAWDDSTTIQVELSQSATEYEPYHETITTNLYLPEQIKMVGDEAEHIDYAEQKQHVATTYMVSITPKTDVSKIEFVTMSSVPDDCTILTSGLIFTLDEADANTLNSTNYAAGVRGKASTAHNYKFTWTKRYTEGETYYIRSYVKYQTADNEIKEVYGDVYKADINGFERVRKNLLPNTATSQTINTELDVTLPALPTLPGTNVLSVGTAVQPSKVYVKYKGERQ